MPSIDKEGSTSLMNKKYKGLVLWLPNVLLLSISIRKIVLLAEESESTVGFICKRRKGKHKFTNRCDRSLE